MLCNRCNSPSSKLKMSFFNTDMCCNSCLVLESRHELYEKAKTEELKAVKRGDFKFAGIGLPDDLKL